MLVSELPDPLVYISVTGGEEGTIEIKILPDAAGKFGFNIKGGVDQTLPVKVTNVAAGSPAGAAIPPLEELDQVVSINGTAVNTLAHSQIVSMIKTSAAQYGHLTMVVRKPNGSSDGIGGVGEFRRESVEDEKEYELPDLPKMTPETSNLLDRSMSILQKVGMYLARKYWEYWSQIG